MKNERNYGIDLLRIVSMFYIVMLHSIGYGGVTSAPMWSRQYMISWAIYTWTFSAVNIFALISGYVGYSDKPKQYKYENYIILWLQVVFYGILVTFCFSLYAPALVTKKDYINALMPIKHALYWYFTAYTGLFFLIPLLNDGIRNSSKRYLKNLFITIIILFSLYEILGSHFQLQMGMSFVWLLILYLLGAIMRKCDIGSRIPTYTAFGGIVLLNMVSWYCRVYGLRISIFGTIIYKESFEQYTSPNFLLIAILYVIVFSRIKIRNNFLKRLISFAAPGTFAVYLLNTQDKIWNYVIPGCFSYLTNQSIYTLVTHIVVSSVLFVMVALVIDYIRRKLFQVLHIREAAEWIVWCINKVLNICVRVL